MKTTTTYQCEICGKEYSSASVAAQCESEHKIAVGDKENCLVALDHTKISKDFVLQNGKYITDEFGTRELDRIDAVPFVTSCGVTFWCATKKGSILDSFLPNAMKFCPHCGKPIKRCSIETLNYVLKNETPKNKFERRKTKKQEIAIDVEEVEEQC